ncbi:hypothetical protein [Cochlodiniinecator piscidefendens]|uniref:hypothetical protein n=1 Tax=Cochlodiniinecator piscidefendens TaxID=2715756 RepID=UPI00140B264D|nr:hypothetical protein [Cochlodiniinecator piscidefendens]
MSKVLGDLVFVLTVGLGMLIVGPSNRPAMAQDEREMLNPIDCLKAIEPLNLTYRSHLQTQCLAIAANSCDRPDETLESSGACLAEMSMGLRDYYSQLRPLLPEQIEGTGFGPLWYPRGVAAVDEVFSDLSYCANFAGFELRFCEFMALGSSMAMLFHRARQADVSLP